MEKVPEAFKWEMPMASLYRDDVEAVLGIFSAHQLEPEIEIGGYKLDDVDELSLVDGVTHQMSVTCWEPRVALRVLAFGGYVDSSPDPVARAVALELRHYLERCRDRGRVAVVRVSQLAISVAFTLVLASVVIGLASGSQWSLVLLLAAAVIFPFGRWGWRETMRRNVRVISTHSRSQRSGFFKRNADQLVVGAVLVMVGALAGSVVTRVFG